MTTLVLWLSMGLAVQTVLYQKLFLLFIRKLRALLVFSCAALLTDCFFFLPFRGIPYEKHFSSCSGNENVEKAKSLIIFIFKIYCTLLFSIRLEQKKLARVGKWWCIHNAGLAWMASPLAAAAPLLSIAVCTSSFSINTNKFCLLFATYILLLHMSTSSWYHIWCIIDFFLRLLRLLHNASRILSCNQPRRENR